MSYAQFGTRWAREVVEIVHDVECLDGDGFWAVVVTFEGQVTCVRFGQVFETRPSDLPAAGELPRQVLDWAPLTGDWNTSLDETAYRLGVSQIRDRIAEGEVYQVCLCRVLSHPLSNHADLAGLETLVAQANPAPFAGRVYVPEAGLDVLSASPEAFLIRRAGRIESRPIKGTATALSTMLVKDYSESPGPTSWQRRFRPDRCRGRRSRQRCESSPTSSLCPAVPIAGRSDGLTQTPARRSLPSASERSGRIETQRDSGG